MHKGKAVAKVFRFNPIKDHQPYYETYEVAFDPTMTVLDVLLSIYRRYDGSLAFRYQCRAGLCGECAVKVNGVPVLACKERAKEIMTIEPLSQFRVLKDMVVDRAFLYESLRKLRVFMERVEPPSFQPESLPPSVIKDVEKIAMCIDCLACMSKCPVFGQARREFVGPALMVRLSRIAYDPRDQGKREQTTVSEGLFNCTLCSACSDVCPMEISIPGDVITRLRKRAIDDGKCPKGVDAIRQHIKENHNVYDMPKGSRTDWVTYMDMVDKVRVGKKSSTVYFVGCVSSFKGRAMSIAAAVSAILNDIGADWSLLGNDERCCGLPSLLSGDVASAEAAAEHNMNVIRCLHPESVLFSCAGCYRMFTEEYPKLVGDLGFDVYHTSQFIERMLGEDKVKLDNRIESIATYHDPCELGRYCGEYDSPRKILESIPGLEFRELREHGRLANCCGGGGLVKSSNPELALRLAVKRLDEILDINAQAVVTECPTCKLNLIDASTTTNRSIDVLDITEITAMAMGLLAWPQSNGP